ncbi:hypothetical protein VTO42DRAFT_6888 [Malbranchea cinnamomea]
MTTSVSRIPAPNVSLHCTSLPDTRRRCLRTVTLKPVLSSGWPRLSTSRPVSVTVPKTSSPGSDTSCPSAKVPIMNWPVFASRPPLPNMSPPTTSKRLKTGVPANPPPHPLSQQPGTPFAGPGQFDPPSMVPHPAPAPAPQPQNTQIPPPTNPRKRRASIQQPVPMGTMPPPSIGNPVEGENNAAPAPTPAAAPVSATPENPPAAPPPGKKKGRTNTPWTAEEEQRLKAMRDAGNTWSEIAKTFPLRTEGSVKKHWYKDMHYAEFSESETIALREAIKEYEANKWKVIGQKIGKPAKACEQYAKEHFKNL